ncbi:Protein of unknown function [Pyronema omphalodes CBS 100304]|uniref:Uncharacterized protein n=1 Tax=Pyronema omphalodes (strain CBS 100304) TaxID=1076935 RepID=U4KWM3_PYROM|nr:Protein of unknown function [Pyronema omphalodes CBS 100304]
MILRRVACLDSSGYPQTSKPCEGATCFSLTHTPASEVQGSGFASLKSSS